MVYLVYEKKAFWSCTKTPQKRAKGILVMPKNTLKTGKIRFGRVLKRLKTGKTSFGHYAESSKKQLQLAGNVVLYQNKRKTLAKK